MNNIHLPSPIIYPIPAHDKTMGMGMSFSLRF